MEQLIMPSDRFSPIDFLMEVRDLDDIKGIIQITTSCYNRSKEDPYFDKRKIKDGEELWIGKEITLNGKYYPPLEYPIRKVDDGYIVNRINDHEFSGKVAIIIDYEG